MRAALVAWATVLACLAGVNPKDLQHSFASRFRALVEMTRARRHGASMRSVDPEKWFEYASWPKDSASLKKAFKIPALPKSVYGGLPTTKPPPVPDMIPPPLPWPEEQRAPYAAFFGASAPGWRPVEALAPPPRYDLSHDDPGPTRWVPWGAVYMGDGGG